MKTPQTKAVSLTFGETDILVSALEKHIKILDEKYLAIENNPNANEWVREVARKRVSIKKAQALYEKILGLVGEFLDEQDDE